MKKPKCFSLGWRVTLEYFCWVARNPFNSAMVVFGSREYSAKWDNYLFTHLSTMEEVRIPAKYEIEIGEARAWTANHPYASFTPYDGGKLDLRPSLFTVFWADKILKEKGYKWRGGDLVLYGEKEAKWM